MTLCKCDENKFTHIEAMLMKQIVKEAEGIMFGDGDDTVLETLSALYGEKSPLVDVYRKLIRLGDEI